MLIQHQLVGNKGRFYVEYEGEAAAEMVYTMTSDNKMIVEHTEVDQLLQGNNVGFELVHAAVEYARHHMLKIIPVCPFTRAVIDKKPDWSDVLDIEEDVKNE